MIDSLLVIVYDKYQKVVQENYLNLKYEIITCNVMPHFFPQSDHVKFKIIEKSEKRMFSNNTYT